VALVTQDVTLANGDLERTYSPFEGMTEAQRLVTAVPRGLVRFFSNVALDAKPVNDTIILNITGSLPSGFAYIQSSLSFEFRCDRAGDWDGSTRYRIFNGLPVGVAGNEQVATFAMASHFLSTTVNSRILHFQQGTIRDYFPQPLVQTKGALGMSFTLEAGNDVATAQAAGTMFFNAAFYQYELNQAVRFPLNFPIPVGAR